MQEYVPTLTRNESTLIEFLSHHGYLSEDGYKPTKNMVSDVLEVVRMATHHCSPHVFVWIVFLVVAALSVVL